MDPSSRVERLRQAMSKQGLDAFYCRKTSDIAWLTQAQGVFDAEEAHLALVTPACAQVHTDSRYSNALRNALDATCVDDAVHANASFHTAVSLHGEASSPWQVDDAVCSHSRFAQEALGAFALGDASDLDGAGKINLGIDTQITLAEYRTLQESVEGELPVRLVETKDLIIGLRSVKDQKELDALQRAQDITDAAFAEIVEWMTPGMTERQVQQELDRRMLKLGADGLAFDTIVATGPRGANPHCIPGDAVLEDGHMVVMDFGARWGGYCADMTRCVSVGQPDELSRSVYEAVRFANETVEARLKAGVTGVEAHQLAESCLEQRGFAGLMGHGLGHGVGLDIHEQPCLNRRNVEALVPGNVVTVEPGVYIPGKIGCRLEDFGVITPDGFHVFTKTSHELVII